MTGLLRTRVLITALLFATVTFISLLGDTVLIQAQPTPPPYDPDNLQPPTELPIAAFGAAIYPENCAPCHGPTGLGDGPTAAELEVPPAAFADPALTWERAPAELFHVTKFGRIQNLMPPWQNQLSDLYEQLQVLQEEDVTYVSWE